MHPPSDDAPALVADIGGTNARFALIGDNGRPERVQVLRCADYPHIEAAIRAYLAIAAPTVPPRRAAVAVAGPITSDQFALTNHIWSFSRRAVEAALGLDRLTLVNDFTAAALSVPHLDAGDVRFVGPARGDAVAPRAPIGVIGPGSGLGVSGLVPVAGLGDGPVRWVALATEGGHVTAPAVTDREAAVFAVLRRRYTHVSAERVVSGQGLVNLYEALSSLDGAEPAPLEPAEISAAGLAGTDPVCSEALEMFCALLGSLAGNLALTLGARGGVYVAGGIVPKLGDFIDRSPFRSRFEAKGRMSGYLAPITTAVILHPIPAFIGLKAVLDGEGPAGDA